jgi:hypothetical protein
VIVVVVISVGFAVELNNFLPANSVTTTGSSNSSSQSGSTSTVTGTLGTTPGNCPSATNQTSEGYRLALYAPSTVTAGQTVCINTSFMNISNQSDLAPKSEYVVVRNSPSGAPSYIFLQTTCFYSGGTSSFGPDSLGWNCSVSWNTAKSYDGLVATNGLYTVWAVVTYSWEATPIFAVGDINVRSTGNESTTSTSQTATQPVNGSSGVPTCTFLNGQTHVLFPPLQQSGPIYLKVITSQGTLTNGTVFAAHQASASDSQGSADYCISLSADTNSTGFMQISDTGAVETNGLPLGGAYNFTVRAGYQGETFQVAVPQIVVQPNAITYITISIASGEVVELTVACEPGNACSSATATISGSGVG